MTVSNAELMKRADIALSNLQADGGLLNPEQANAFIDMIQEQDTILKQARVVRMNAPTRKINRLGFDQRILRAATQDRNYTTPDGDGNFDDVLPLSRWLQASDRSKPKTAQIELNTKEVIAEVHLPYEVLEDNIEQESFESHIMRLIAERAALDLEELALTGDTASSDPYLALLDGLLKQAGSHVVNNTSSGIGPTLFEAGMLAMPQKYLRTLAGLRHFVTVADTIRYRGMISQRTSGYGDSMLTGNGPIFAYGVAVESAPLMPAATGLFTFPQNILYGIQRQIQIETDKDIRAREIIIVLTARIDVLFDEEDAVVKYVNI